MSTGIATNLPTTISNTTMNYYQWNSNASTSQCSDIVIQIPIPTDFSAWNGTNPISVNDFASNNQAKINIMVQDSTGKIEPNVNYSNITPSSLNNWTSENIGSLSGTYKPGGVMTIYLKNHQVVK